MNTDKSSFVHNFSLFYLFTLGGSLFTFGKCGIFCFLCAAVLGVITLFLFIKIKKTKNRFSLFFIEVLCVLSGIYTFGKFVYFIKEKQLFYIPKLAVGFVFAAVVIYLVLSGKKNILKFSFFGFCVGSLFFGVLFFATIKNADFSDIKYALDFNIKETVKVYFLLFFPSVIPVFWAKPSFKSAVSGMLGASVTLLCFIILTYCTFGKINQRLDSPILALVDSANVGRVFTRLDAFLLAIIYLSCLIRCGVSFKTAYEISATFNSKKQRSELTKNTA